MKRVILESPYGAAYPAAVDANLEYARRCVRDSLLRDEAPIASHMLHTLPGILRDDVPEERALGIAAGLAWLSACEAMVVYKDRGISPGMEAAIALALQCGIPVERRTIDEPA